MGTIGVWDADFFQYEDMIPNLECAKLVNYFRKKHEIASLSSTLSPQKYTKFYIRKDINDGRFYKQFFEDNCIYGGRAFETVKYSSLEPEIESIIPDMHVYERFTKYYSQSTSNQQSFKAMLNKTHLRLMPFDNQILDVSFIINHMKTVKSTGLILHDYDIASIPNVFEILKEISESRFFKAHPNDIHPYSIGNKFPIWVDNDDDLYKWMRLRHLRENSYIGCTYFRTDRDWKRFFYDFERSKTKIGYKIDQDCSSEDDFLINRLPQIYKQVLYFWNTGHKFSLTYDTKLIRSKELRDLIGFINFRFNLPFLDKAAPQAAALNSFCNYYTRQERYGYREKEFTTQEIRNSFQYVRERNYELFKMFYEWDKVKFDKGELVSEWS